MLSNSIRIHFDNFSSLHHICNLVRQNTPLVITMNITVSKIGSREFLNLDDRISIPIDRIKRFDFINEESNNSVRIVTDDPNEELIFRLDDCEDIREFLLDCIE